MRTVPSRIVRIFSRENQKKLFDICHNTSYKRQYDKIDDIKEIVEPLGCEFLGAGTNRVVFLQGKYAFKIALDYMGWEDNLTEVVLNRELLNYGAIRCFETNGLIMGCQYVYIIPPDAFPKFRKSILEICKKLSRKYVFADLGYSNKNYFNWGMEPETGKCKFLDYGYMFKKDPLLFRCPNCKTPLTYDENYVEIFCPHCGNKYSFFDVRNWCETTDEVREEIFKDVEEVKVEISDIEAFKLDELREKENSSYKPLLRL